MEIRVLKYFLTIAREENITKAAKILHVTQPTLSRQLMQLEEELGVKLFKRSNHNIILTEEGIMLRQRARELTALADKIKTDLRHDNDGPLTGEIVIGCGETHSMNCLSQVMTSFRRQYPQVHFSIYTATADDIKAGIDQGLMDMGLVVEPAEISKYDFIRMPQKELWGVLMRKDSPLAQKDYVTAEDLTHMPLIMSRREDVKRELANWFGDCFDQIEVAATGTLQYNMSVMVKNHIGTAIGLLLDNVSYPELCLRPLFPKLETGTIFIWKKYQLYAPAAQKFIEYCKNHIK